MRVDRLAVKTPPAFQAIDRKFRSVGGYSHRHVSGILSEIVDSKRNRHAFPIACEVSVRFYWCATPNLSLSSVVADELLLFCVDADDRESLAKELRPQGGDISELLITIGVLGPCLLFLVNLQRIAHLAQQSCDSAVAGLMAMFLRFFAEITKTAAYPFLAAHRIASN